MINWYSNIRIIVKKISLVAASLAVLSLPVSSMGAGGSFKTSLDSAYILMGNKTSLKFKIISNDANEGIVTFVKDSIPAEIEIEDRVSPIKSQKSVGNGRYEIIGEYIIQSFDSGDYRIPGLMYINGNDTLVSNAVNLKVVPVDVEDDQDIFTEASPLDGGRGFFDWVPWWWYLVLIGLLVVGAGVLAYLIMSKKVVIKLPAKKPIPPYKKARMALDEVRVGRMWEKGQDKAYYTRLTYIMRNYMFGRYGINAMELTTNQILDALKELNLPEDMMVRLKNLFVTADFVKFAKLKPSADENIQSYDVADNFVEMTRPVENPEDEQASGKANSVKSSDSK